MKTDSEIVRWLCALKNRGSKFGVERMEQFDAAQGYPSRAVPIVHVAGSNGKGSTCAMFEAIFRAHGLRTGLYTSPHLVRLGERVQVNREPLTDAVIERYVEELRPVAERLGAANPDDAPSFFEFMTAMAYLEFQRRAVDVAVVETGLGGRLDATNIATPRLSVITSISLEHTEYLGDSVEKIAAEKGGIIKAGVPVVVGLVPCAAEKVLREIAAERGSSAFFVRETFRNVAADDGFPCVQLSGEHQRANAALALLGCRVLASSGDVFRVPQFSFSENVARNVLRDGVNWAARWQTFPLSRGRRLIIDAAHNAECADALEPLLAALVRETGKRPVVITGVLGLERARPLLAVLARYAAALCLVQPAQERACTFAELESCVPNFFRGKVLRSDLDAVFPKVGECVLPGGVFDGGVPDGAGDCGDVIVAAGSVYLAGEILSRFLSDSAVSPCAFNFQDKLPAA